MARKWRHTGTQVIATIKKNTREGRVYTIRKTVGIDEAEEEKEGGD